MGSKVGTTRHERSGEVEKVEDKEEEEQDDERNDILVVKKQAFNEHSLGGYFTKRHCFLGGEKREGRMKNQTRW